MDLLQLSAYRTSKISQLKTPCRARASLTLQYCSSLSQLRAIITPSSLSRCPTPSIIEYGRKNIRFILPDRFSAWVYRWLLWAAGLGKQEECASWHRRAGRRWGKVEPPFDGGSLSHLPLLGGRKTTAKPMPGKRTVER